MSNIVVGASYAVYDRDPTIASPIDVTPGGICGGSTHVALYSADGQFLSTVEHKLKFVDSFVDPRAPLPRVASYRRIWWPAIDIGDGWVTGKPGYVVLFHDRHGHRIGWDRLESGDAPIVSGRFDVTDALEETPNFSRKPTAAEREPSEAEPSCSLQ